MTSVTWAPALSVWRGYDLVVMQVVPRLAVEPMRYEDIAAVQAIERQVFASPWPKNAYASELSQNRQASYIVLRQDNEIVGYAGLWRVALEAHVTTIGVRAGDHSKGYGTVLFAALVQRAYALGARWITLEVRDTNDHAIRLYERFGFKAIGRRRGYYTDNGEDAVIMWSDSIHAPEFKRAFLAILGGLDAAGVGGGPSMEYPSA
jgi:ribosomal-protein-alanine N-acetyltransferase